MDLPQIISSIEQLPEGWLCVAFTGVGKVGSDGNEQGDQMCATLRQAIAEYSPTGIIFDFREFDYQFGNWIMMPAIKAWAALGTGHVGLMANGRTAESLSNLMTVSKLNRHIPLAGSFEEVLAVLRQPK